MSPLAICKSLSLVAVNPFNVSVADTISPLLRELLSVAGTSFPDMVTSVELYQHLCASWLEISVFGSATKTSISDPTYELIGVAPIYI